jgi:AsmA protein
MRLVKALFAVVLGLVVLLGAVLFLVPTERLAGIAADQFRTATGRTLTIGGEVGLSVFPVLGARAQDITIGNPDWADGGDILRAGEMDIGVDVMSLFSGTVAVQRVVLQSPVITLQRRSDGRATWEFGTGDAAPAPGGSGTMRDLSLAEARIVDGTVRFRDETTQMALELTGLDATLAMPQAAGPLTLEATGRFNGQPLSVAFQAGNVADMLAGGLTAVTLQAELAGANAQFDGRLALSDLTLDGDMQGRLPALVPVMTALGQAGSEIPQDYLPIVVDGRVTRTAEGQVFLRGGSATFGQTAMTADADLSTDGPRPRLNAQVSIPALDLRGQGGDAPAAQPEGWPRTPIDASALGLIDGDIALSVGQVRSDSGTFGPIRLRTTIDAARAVTDIREAQLFGGRVTGQFIANNRSGLSVRAALQAADISLLAALRDVAGFERLEGTARANVDLLGSGNTIDAIMNSLQGSGSVAFEEGEIIGLDLAGMLRNLDLSYVGEGSRTIYNSITGSFDVAGGVLRNDDLLFESSRVQVTGAGDVGIGQRVLDYRIVPSALRDEAGNALRVPLIVTGPWNAPRLRLDMEALARERLAEEQERLEEMAREEARRLEDRARAEAAERIERELGVQREDGERLEDTLRRGVEQRMGEGLRGLLGGN